MRSRAAQSVRVRDRNLVGERVVITIFCRHAELARRIRDGSGLAVSLRVLYSSLVVVWAVFRRNCEVSCITESFWNVILFCLQNEDFCDHK